MDMGDVRGLITIITMFTFIGICWWAYHSKNRDRFEQDALLPFADEQAAEKGRAGEPEHE
jgi:cytochrome c oxidase cbb3-type subunit 4